MIYLVYYILAEFNFQYLVYLIMKIELIFRGQIS